MRNTDTLARILDTALQILSSGGLEELHARSIGSRLKLNHATVHYYFKTRPALLAAVADYALEQFLAEREEQLRETKPSQALRQEIRFYLRQSENETHLLRAWPSLMVASQTDPALRAKLLAIELHLTSLVGDSIEKSRAAGVKVRKGVLRRPVVLTSLLISLSQRSEPSAEVRAGWFGDIEEELLK